MDMQLYVELFFMEKDYSYVLEEIVNKYLLFRLLKIDYYRKEFLLNE